MKTTQSLLLITWTVGACLASAAAFAGSSSSAGLPPHPDPVHTPGGDGSSSSAGVPNPMAGFCERNGGLTLTYQSDAGDVAVCQLGRAEIEVGTLLRALGGGPSTQQATRAFLEHAPSVPHAHHGWIGNPAAEYCAQVQGASRIVRSQAGEAGFCQFADRSLIDEWTLFGGPAAQGNERLAALLAHH